jgi:hypothetical protein
MENQLHPSHKMGEWQVNPEGIGSTSKCVYCGASQHKSGAFECLEDALRKPCRYCPQKILRAMLATLVILSFIFLCWRWGEAFSENSKPNGLAQASTPESRCGAYNQECIARETHKESARAIMRLQDMRGYDTER